MKSSCRILLIIILGFIMLNAQDEKEDNKISVLITSGGHGFEEKHFFEMFDKMPGISFHHIQLPDSMDLLRPGLEEKFDVIVMYDMMGDSISRAQKQAFISLLKKGIGVVSLHHNLGAYPDWEEFKNIIGGKYIFNPGVYNGQKYSGSSYTHDLDFIVKTADKNHPITQGVSDFEIHDETYKDFYTAPNVHVLLTTDSPLADPEIAWVLQYESSPVFYLQLGHDSKAWSNPNFSRLLQNAIHWSAETVKDNLSR